MRIVRALFSVAKTAAKEPSSWDRFLYKADGFCKYGLLRDDLLTEHDPVVREALRRLPEELQNQRIYRASKAAILSMNKVVLPEEEWTKMEEDIPYLTPYVEEVEAELKEKAEWEDKNPL